VLRVLQCVACVAVRCSMMLGARTDLYIYRLQLYYISTTSLRHLYDIYTTSTLHLYDNYIYISYISITCVAVRTSSLRHVHLYLHLHFYHIFTASRLHRNYIYTISTLHLYDTYIYISCISITCAAVRTSSLRRVHIHLDYLLYLQCRICYICTRSTLHLH